MEIQEVSRIMAQMNEGINKLVGQSLAYIKIQEKSPDAIRYCQKYNVGAWGDNIWHAVLEDAIKLREQLTEKGKE